ncbi:MAG: hypothetical protein RBU45_13765 [Myxococcota bacterium]|jgi:hypothetical protein|nr:hypothetical protein [Myxococcota bacterium]
MDVPSEGEGEEGEGEGSEGEGEGAEGEGAEGEGAAGEGAEGEGAAGAGAEGAGAEGEGAEGEGAEGEGAEGEGEGAAECVADSLEVNDVPAQAAALPAMLVEGLSLCAGDQDWFRLPLTRNDGVVITVQGDGLQVALRAPDGVADVAASVPFHGGAQAARQPIPTSGNYLILVSGAVTSSYTLEVEVISGGEGEGEGEGAEGEGEGSGGTSCSEIYSCAGECGTQNCFDDCVAQGSASARNDWNSMYDCWERNCAQYANDQNGFQSCVQTYCMNETMACLQGGEGEGEGEVGPCQDDGWEPNDTARDAATIQAGETIGVVCPRNEDWFEVAVPARETLTVDLLPDDFWKDFSLYLVSAEGAELFAAATFWQAMETATYTAVNDERVFVRVIVDDPFGLHTAATGYTLGITLGDPVEEPW